MLQALVPLLFASLTLADLTCKGFYSWGRTSNRYALTFGGFTGGGFEIPDTYVIAGNPVVLSNSQKIFTNFAVETCNSTSLAISEFQTNFPCDGSGCFVAHHNYIRLISPKSGDCLTARPFKQIATTSELYPSKCNPNPSTANQLFLTYQAVEYSTSGKYLNHGPVDFINFNGEQPTNPGFPSSEWDLAPDNKTVIFYPPTGQDPTDAFAAELV